jgi:hypothetical protein
MIGGVAPHPRQHVLVHGHRERRRQVADPLAHHLQRHAADPSVLPEQRMSDYLQSHAE